MERTRITLHPTAGDDPWVWHLYQRYYLAGLQQLPDVELHHEAKLDVLAINARRARLPGGRVLLRGAARRQAARRFVQATHVGRYTFQFPGAVRPLRVAIDTHDMRHIRDPEALEWAELYFKASWWPSLDYGPKVRPLVCGNGALDRNRVRRLMGMRDPRSRDLDLTFIAKLWPSNVTDPTYWNPVEHLVRVFETLARLPIRSYLRAIVPQLADGKPFPGHYLDRLRAAGVPLIEGGQDISVKDLWSATSHSQLAFLRPGKHLCVSWRMIDHLAMGAATLCDKAAYPQWPVPLQAGREFFDVDCGIGPDESLPATADYARIGDTVMSLLGEPERLIASRSAAAAYFDRHVAHARLARYIVDEARCHTRKASDVRPIVPPPRSDVPAQIPLEATLNVDDTGVHPAHTSLLEFTNDAVIVWEKDGRGIVYWNRAAEELYGYKRDEVNGRSTHALLMTQLQGGVPAIERGLDRHGIWVGELRHRHKNGTVMIVEARLAVLAQTSGRWLVLEVNRDVSDKKKAEAASLSMRQQLEQYQRLVRPPDDED